MTGRVAVLTDSAASLPPELASAHDVTVVPLRVSVGDLSFDEGQGISPLEVADALASHARVTTSQPGQETFRAALAQAVAQGADSVLVVTLSRQLSGTYESARAAAQDASVPVQIVDSGTVAMAQGFAALAAADRARHGGTLDECAAAARRVADGSMCVFTVDSLEPLRRGGRLSVAAAALGTALALRPLLSIADGRVVIDSRERTTRRARAAIAARAVQALTLQDDDADTVAVAAVLGLHDEAVAQVTGPVAHDAPGSLLVTGPVPAVLTAHAGAGAIAAVVARVPASLARGLEAR
ncbi:DegV family protein [Demequina capsici]|uniref:DegV family protein n=1 Tax=Demequina capsici TaxID=3075620 RepID=A0AA96FBB8_9MICO|nr:DegV family protein [Demequina sp. OYTSA14]WNM25466.1 DegV family protein [Demequina sp. OYTSA14]